MEMQFIHQNADREFAIISVLVEEGKVLTALEPLFKVIPDDEGDLSPTIEINPMAFLPPKRTFFFYEGSLTTPPCTEGVKWFILTQSVDVSSKQLDILAHFHKNNVRPLQKTQGRTIWRSAR
jgi:carbonic anhydrase